MAVLSSEELKIIKEMKGKVIGHGLKKDWEFVLEREGREGLRKVEDEMEKLGYNLKYEQIEKYTWYPCCLDTLFLVLSQRIFNWDDKKMQEWGSWEAKTHFLTRLMIKYFVSIEVLAKKVDRYWEKYYTVGELETREINRKERYLFLLLKNYKTLPSHLHFLEGYFYQIGTFVLPKDKLKTALVNSKPAEGEYLFKMTW